MNIFCWAYMVVVVVPPRNYQLSALPPIKTLTPTLTIAFLKQILIFPIYTPQ